MIYVYYCKKYFFDKTVCTNMTNITIFLSVTHCLPCLSVVAASVAASTTFVTVSTTVSVSDLSFGPKLVKICYLCPLFLNCGWIIGQADLQAFWDFHITTCCGGLLSQYKTLWNLKDVLQSKNNRRAGVWIEPPPLTQPEKGKIK